MITKLFFRLAFVLVVLIIAAVLNRKKAGDRSPVVVVEHDNELIPADSSRDNQSIVLEPTDPDDLTEISGIGPKISQALNDAGILTYAQLGDSDEETINQIMRESGMRLGNPASWIEQANNLRAD